MTYRLTARFPRGTDAALARLETAVRAGEMTPDQASRAVRRLARRVRLVPCPHLVWSRP